MTENLTAALAAVQAELPRVAKTETAKVETRGGGSYKYSYADLAAVSAAVLPKLAAHGLAWVTRPTLADGRLVLAYELRHTSGDSIEGSFPLTGNTPQEIGSAITYARRYCLCSVTGVAPESDDDDAAAASHKRTEESWEVAKPPTPGQVANYDLIAADVEGTADEHALIGIGRTVQEARTKHLITETQYDKLARRAAERLAELRVGSGDGDRDA